MHLCREGLTGSKGLSKAFNLNMLYNCKMWETPSGTKWKLTCSCWAFYIPIAGPSCIPVAGPSVPIQERIDCQQRLEQGFQAWHNQQLQNHGEIVESQQVTRQQERYTDEEHQHAAHLAELGQLGEGQRERECLAHLAALSEQREKWFVFTHTRNHVLKIQFLSLSQA